MNDETVNQAAWNHGGVDHKRLGHLCEDCGPAFSEFLNEMAEHNAKVTACPKCGKHHPLTHRKAARTVECARSHNKKKTVS